MAFKSKHEGAAKGFAKNNGALKKKGHSGMSKAGKGGIVLSPSNVSKLGHK